MTSASAEKFLTAKHEIQFEQRENICIFTIFVSVKDSIMEKPVSDALVEFQITSEGTISNYTNSNGTTEIFLMKENEPGKSCMEILLSKGYTVKVSKIGYTGLGFGRVA